MITVLEALLSLIKNEDIVLVNIYNENSLLLITFELPGYMQLKSELLTREVDSMVIKAKSVVDITVKAAANPTI